MKQILVVLNKAAKVEFTVDSKPGETFTGYVSEIAKGTKGNMGATSNSVVYYTVKVQIPENISNEFLTIYDGSCNNLWRRY